MAKVTEMFSLIDNTFGPVINEASAVSSGEIEDGAPTPITAPGFFSKASQRDD